MMIFATNRGLQISLNLQSRCLVFSLWTKKRHDSSGPVRYVPRDYTQIKKPHKSPSPWGSYEKRESNLLKATASEGGNSAPKTPKFDDNGFHNRLFNAGPRRSSDILAQIEEFSEFEDANDAVLEFVDTDVRDESELLLDKATNSCVIKGTKKDEIVCSKTKQDAEQLAIELLATRAFTTLELQKKLRGKKYSLDIVDSVIAEIKGRYNLFGFRDHIWILVSASDKWRWVTLTLKVEQMVDNKLVMDIRLIGYPGYTVSTNSHWKKHMPSPSKKRGLLNDGLYAESFSQSRWLSSTWGPRRIKQALLKKGISEVEADKAAKQVFEDDDGSGESHNVHHGMSKTSMDRLFLQASKQWLRGHSTSLQNRKARMVRWLQYRGFSWGVASTILKKLESQYPLQE